MVGIHLFYSELKQGITARCRNFAPLFGIDEESATGTANPALTWHLKLYGIVEPRKINYFIQGEAMGKPSVVQTMLTESNKGEIIKVGGSATIVFKGELW